MPTLGFVKKFRKEFEDYIAGNKAGTPIITVNNWSELATNYCSCEGRRTCDTR